MFVITKTLVQKMDEMLLKAFLKKVEHFIIENVSDQIISDIDLSQYIIEKYNSAKNIGIKTERDIVSFILKELSKNTK